MAPRRRIRRLAVLVDTTPDRAPKCGIMHLGTQMLVEIMGDVFSETINELQTYKPRACGRIARDIRPTRSGAAGAGTGR